MLEDAQRCMVSLHDIDWVDVLGTVEFAPSTLVSSSTKMSPFEIDTGRVARMPIGAAMRATLQKIAAALWLKRNKTWPSLKIDSAHSTTRNGPARCLLQATFVYLATKNLPLAHAATGTSIQKDKFAPNLVGPFMIIKMINNNAAQLSLPRSMSRLHDTFNINVLRHHVKFPARFVDRLLPKVSTVDFLPGDADADMHVIEALMKKRQRNRRTEYLVRWQNLDSSESSWEREQDINHIWH
ncbi:hypothetical protein PHMEG_00017963 [Phytophthora megakarya]|uniref:Chromo domain-containing protein n=1 Tax=Phytophthora megakarya TaxID=4795 RepID=A0A225VVA0_9STRA|nr:hypothetical protein PHMEG_00017963 [Phytophthora megakarya]